MTNKDAADLLEAFANVLELRGANQFRVRAFRTASRRVDGLTVDLGELVASDSLESVPGIGKGIAGFLRELVTTGRVAEYEELRAEIPPGVFDMLRVPGLGPKTAATLYSKLQITSIDELEAAARANDLAKVRSIGAKRQERLLRELQRFRERTARHLLGDVLPLAEHLAAHVRAAPGVSEATYAGSLRRMRETIGDLDILAAADDPDPVMRHFIDHEAIDEVLASGSTKSSVLVANNLQVDLLVVPPASYGAALVYFTGSKEHNIELRHRALALGLSLNEWGLDEVDTQVRRSAPSEADVYAALGLPVIPPELRRAAARLRRRRTACCRTSLSCPTSAVSSTGIHSGATARRRSPIWSRRRRPPDTPSSASRTTRAACRSPTACRRSGSGRSGMKSSRRGPMFPTFGCCTAARLRF